MVHVLPSDDPRIAGIVRAQVERIDASPAEGPPLRLLVLVPAADESPRLAGDVNDGLDAAGALLVPAHDAERGARRASLGAAAVATSPALAQELLRRSALKTDAVHAVVLVHLDTLTAQAGDTLDEVLAEVPRSADRIAVTGELTPAVEAFLERHARRARRMHYEATAPSTATLQYVVCDRNSRTAVLARLLDSIDPEHATVVAAEDDAETACAGLAHLGYGPDDQLVAFSDGDVPAEEDLVVLYTAPADAQDLEPIQGANPGRVVALVAPDELTGFLRLFGQAVPVALPSVHVRRAGSRLDALRLAARDVMAQRSLHHELLALAPLFEERDAAEVAAALLSLLEHQPAAVTAVPTRPIVAATAEARPTPARAAREERAEPVERPAPRPRERAAREGTGEVTPLFINVGLKDGAKKGDLVGALLNESGISSDQLGRITMREMGSVVEVDSSVADQVIEAITGKTIRGRVVNARVDRRPEARGERRRDERPFRRGASRGPRDEGGPPRGRPSRSRDDAGAGRPQRGFGGARSARPGAERGGRKRDDSGGPRPFREGERSGRAPRAIAESREWGERGERLRNARRPRRERE